MIDTLLQDVRYAVALLVKKPAFSVVAILGLTLGIGANTAIFSVVNALLLRPLPYSEPDRLVKISSHDTIDPAGPEAISYPNFIDWRDQNHVFESMAAFTDSDMNLTGIGDPERLHGAQASYDLFSVLSVTPILGRSFLAEEDRPGARQVAIISFGLWRRLFGGDRNALGKSLMLEGAPAEIVGVLPPGFNFSRGTDIWLPLAMENDPRQRLNLGLSAVGRLKPGVSLSQAQSEMSGIADQLAEQYPATNKNWTVKLVALQEDVIGKFRTALLVLLGAVVLVLLISCANVANLLLAHAASRGKEVAIRLAVGASRFRIVRQFLTESIILALAGGVLGLLLAVFGVKALTTLASDIPRVDEIGLDTRVLGFTLAVSVITGLVFGLVPALQSSRTNLTDALKEGTKGSSGGVVKQRLRSTLVIAEVAFALMLLVGAGLLLKSFSHLQGVGLGFNPKGLVTFDVQLPSEKYKNPDQRAAFFHQAINNLRAIPGVQNAATTLAVPLSGNGSFLLFYAEGQPFRGPEDYTAANFDTISPSYFGTMGTPIARGRDISDSDDAKSQPVVVISDTMARRFFPGQEALGKRIKLGARPDSDRPWITIVGIAADARRATIEDQAGESTMYFPYLQRPQEFLAFVVRATGDVSALSTAFRLAVQGVDKDQPIANIKTMDQVLMEYNAQRRLTMLLLVIFACVAVLLASIGVYGVMAYSVAQRSHEFGIRLALGARQPALLGMVIGHGMLLAGSGVAVGIGAAFALTRLMSTLLFKVSTTDPVVFGSVSVMLGIVAILACVIPAFRATRVDPMVTLRYE
jgi:predicted permease